MPHDETNSYAPRQDWREDEARRFVGAVYEEAAADIGRNRAGEQVIRIDLDYTRGTAPNRTTLILSTDAAIVLRNTLDSLFAAAGVDDGPEPE